MRTLKLSLFGLVSLLFCNLSHAVDYGTPVTDSKVALFLTFESPRNDWDEDDKLTELVTENELAAFECLPKPADAEVWVAGAIVPIITAIGSRLFDKYQDAKIDRLKKLKKDSMNEYSETLYISSAELKTIKCAVLIRYSVDSKTNKPTKGLVTYIKFDHKLNSSGASKGFTFTPVHLVAKNATVKTITDKKQPKKSKITTAIAVAAKVVIESENKLTSVAPLGAASVGISNVLLDEKERCSKESDCEESDLIPHIDTDTVVALSVGVSEAGHVGIDFDKAEAEINAIKAAYGPALKESLTALLKDD